MTAIGLLGLLSTFIAPAVIIAWSRPAQRGVPPIALAVTIVYGGAALALALHNVVHPREWDFAAFRAYAFAAQSGANFYLPGALAHDALLPNGGDFALEVSNVGFPYPPPTMFLMLPLAAFANDHAALAVWYVVQFSALAAAAMILSRALQPDAKLTHAFYFSAIALLLRPALETVYDAQTNFIALLLLAVAFRERRSARGAAFLAAAVFVKPYTLALVVAEFGRSRAARIVAFAATIATAFAAARIAFGATTVATYFTSNPASRAPVSNFIERSNQSLLAELLRVSGSVPSHVSLAREPLYLALAALLVAITAAFGARLSARDDDVAFAAALSVGLLVYPAALASYGVVLVIPLAVLWTRRKSLPQGTNLLAAIVAVVCLLFALRHGFWAVAVVWTALIGAGSRSNRLTTSRYASTPPTPQR